MHRLKEEAVKELSRAVAICWSEIIPSFFKSLIASMHKRCMAVRTPTGGTQDFRL
jgi:hypothetical protein